MRVFVGYATTEGQTRKIARFVADLLAGSGHMVELLALADADEPELARFDRAVLAGSIHAGGLQPELTGFATDHAEALNRMDTLFLPVSLTASGDDPEDWAALTAILDAFAETTGWQPGRTAHVAGAFRFSEYSLLKGWIMRRIAAEKNPELDGTSDHEFTDWGALADVIDDWTAAPKAGKEAAGTA